MVIGEHFTALLRARRKKERGWDQATRDLYDRHRWRVEGAHGRAKVHHGLRRAARRGIDNIAIQAYLAAAVMNLKVLAAAASRVLSPFWRSAGTLDASRKPHAPLTTPHLLAA
jgi:IS5 family transposase